MLTLNYHEFCLMINPQYCGEYLLACLAPGRHGSKLKPGVNNISSSIH